MKTMLALLMILLPLSGLQAQHSHSTKHSGHSGHSAMQPAKASAPEVRELVEFPPQLKEHTLANMRDHLAALQEIQAALGQGHYGAAAEVAEQRLGMSSMDDHGAHEVAGFMPQGMQAAGTLMHRRASQFAVAARDAEVTEDLPAAVGALGELTATCVACHAAYRLK